MGLQAIVAKRMKIERQMAWRIKHYGYACFTLQEYTALCYEQVALRPYRGDEDHTKAVQTYIAQQMGVTQSWVSRLLQRADDVMAYFDMMEINVGWQYVGGMWRLNAPVAPSVVTRDRANRRRITNIMELQRFAAQGT